MKNIKWIGVLALVTTLAVMVWLTTNQGSAQGKLAADGWDCNMHNISGTYVVAAFGSVVSAENPAGLPVGQYNSAATSTLDGFGHYTITPTTFVNGVMVQDGSQTVSGVYEVGPGCVARFYDPSGQLEIVRTYGIQGHITVQGVSMIPGTNITYLIVRK